MSRANAKAGVLRPIPTCRRRYPSDMALARQSRPDQSVTKDMLKIKGLGALTPFNPTLSQSGQTDPLPPIRGPHAEPAIAYLLVVDARIIDLHRQAKNSGRQAADR